MSRRSRGGRGRKGEGGELSLPTLFEAGNDVADEPALLACLAKSGHLSVGSSIGPTCTPSGLMAINLGYVLVSPLLMNGGGNSRLLTCHFEMISGICSY